MKNAGLHCRTIRKDKPRFNTCRALNPGRAIVSRYIPPLLLDVEAAEDKDPDR